MSLTRYCSFLIPVLLLLTCSINYAQPNPEKRKLIEDRLNNPSLLSLLSINSSITKDTASKVDPQPLNPTQYLLRSGSWPYGASYSIAVDSISNIIYLGSGGAVLVLNGADPSNPVLITDKIRTYGLVEDIFIDISTHRLYLAGLNSGCLLCGFPMANFLFSKRLQMIRRFSRKSCIRPVFIPD